jgi:hypothetical protein
MLIPFGVFSAGAGGGGAAGSYDLISSTILTGSQASVTFDVTGLGSTYKHLQIRAVTKNTSSDGENGFYRFNSDTGSNYSQHFLAGNGSSVFSEGYANLSTNYFGQSFSSNFSPLVIDVLDAFSTSKYKTTRSLSGSGTSRIYMNSNGWRNTAAITTINLYMGSGSFATGSRFSIYGIRG